MFRLLSSSSKCTGFKYWPRKLLLENENFPAPSTSFGTSLILQTKWLSDRIEHEIIIIIYYIYYIIIIAIQIQRYFPLSLVRMRSSIQVTKFWNRNVVLMLKANFCLYPGVIRHTYMSAPQFLFNYTADYLRRFIHTSHHIM